MVSIVVDQKALRALRKAGVANQVKRSGFVNTAPHQAFLKAGLSLVGREVHFSHEDAVAVYEPAPERDPKVEARVEKLKARLADAEYARMVRDVARSSSGDEESISRMVRNAAPAASVGFNLLATMGTCFAIAYFLVKAATDNRSLALGAGAIGIAGALAVEAILVLLRLYRVDDAETRVRERRIRNVERRAIAAVKNRNKKMK